MKKIVILGCENAHANTFLGYLAEGGYPDIQIAGVYSEDRAAAEKLRDTFGVPVMERYDEAVGQVDGIIVTARYGGLHYKYAAPYISSGIPMFIDKPITVDEEEAVEFMRKLKQRNIRIAGGSCCKYIDEVQQMKQAHVQQHDGATLGGFVRCPVLLDSPYGGFSFYSHHLIEIEGEIFGRYPKSVQAFQNGKKITVVFRHDDFDAVGLYVSDNFQYYISRNSDSGINGIPFKASSSSDCFRVEFKNFVDLVRGGEQLQSYEDLIAPVFVSCAIERSLASGKEEVVKEFTI